MNTQSTRRQIITDYIKAYNEFDIPGMLKDLHQDVRFENVAGDTVNMVLDGRAAFAAQAEKAKTLFSAREQQITDLHDSGEQVIVQIAYTGTLAQDLPNGLKAGETIQMPGRSVFTFREDKIAAIRDES